jgi:predicted RecA/RadA family phage recombinase
MQNYVNEGWNLTIPAPGAVSSGDVVIVGAFKGVAQHDAASGDPVVIVTRGVFDLPKVGSQAWAVGAVIYWTGTACTTTVGSNTLIGAAVAAVGSGAGETEGRVRLFA